MATTTANILLLTTMSCAYGCASDPYPCRTLAVEGEVGITGTLTAAGESLDLAVPGCVGWGSFYVLSPDDPLERRFSGATTSLNLTCRGDWEYLIAVVLTDGAPFEPRTEDSSSGVSLRVRPVGDKAECNVLVEPTTYEVSLTASTGETWPDDETPVSADFERVIDVSVQFAPPHADNPNTRDPDDPLCQQARTVSLGLSGTFRVRPENVIQEAGLTCVDGFVEP